MTSPELLLNIHGVTVRVCSQQQSVLEEIGRDFSFFISEGIGESVDYTVVAHCECCEQERFPFHHLLLRTKYFSCYETGGVKHVFYSHGDYVRCSYNRGTADVYSVDVSRLYELVYAVLRSVVGELVENRGLCRIHGLAFARGQQGVLFLAPMHGGKSTLALALLRACPIGLLSEDAPFLDFNLNIYPFPLRIGIRPDGFTPISAREQAYARVINNRKYGKKTLIDIECYQTKVLSEPRRLHVVLIGRFSKKRQSVCCVKRCSRLRLLGTLIVNLVIGVGVSQVKEYYLRRSPIDVCRKACIVSRRLCVAARILHTRTPYLFVLGPDGKTNASTLMHFLAVQSRDTL